LNAFFLLASANIVPQRISMTEIIVGSPHYLGAEFANTIFGPMTRAESQACTIGAIA